MRLWFSGISGLIALATLLMGFADASPPPRPPPEPDRNVSEMPIAGPPFVYPPKMLAEHRQGLALVECDVATDGSTSDCRIVGDVEGGPEFAAAALDYVSHARYSPAVIREKIVAVRHQWLVPPDHMTIPPNLHLQPDGPVSDEPIAGPALVYPPRMKEIGRQGVAAVDCDVTEDGMTKDCKVTCSTGSSAFSDSALEFVSHSRYRPAARDGVRYETRHQWIIPFAISGPAPRGLCGS